MVYGLTQCTKSCSMCSRTGWQQMLHRTTCAGRAVSLSLARGAGLRRERGLGMGSVCVFAARFAAGFAAARLRGIFVAPLREGSRRGNVVKSQNYGPGSHGRISTKAGESVFSSVHAGARKEHSLGYIGAEDFCGMIRPFKTGNCWGAADSCRDLGGIFGGFTLREGTALSECVHSVAALLQLAVRVRNAPRSLPLQ